MNNFIEFGDKIAFHPGYYIEEIIKGSGLSLEDFARKLDVSPERLRVLISGGQRLTSDVAAKLSRLLGTSAAYWLNLQSSYDVHCRSLY